MLDFLPALMRNLTSANRRQEEGKDGKKVTVRTSDLTEALTMLGLLLVENDRLSQAAVLAHRRAFNAQEAARLAYWPAMPRLAAACIATLCIVSALAAWWLALHVR